MSCARGNRGYRVIPARVPALPGARVLRPARLVARRLPDATYGVFVRGGGTLAAQGGFDGAQGRVHGRFMAWVGTMPEARIACIVWKEEWGVEGVIQGVWEAAAVCEQEEDREYEEREEREEEL